MPAILEPSTYKLWLASETGGRKLRDMLFPFSANEMSAYKISKKINSYKNDRDGLLNPVSQK